MDASYILDFSEINLADVSRVGGKNASLGEMIGALSAAGVNVPGGFATTAQAFRDFLDFNQLTTRINAALASLDVADVGQLARTGAQIRDWVAGAVFPSQLDAAIRSAYAGLDGDASVAVRSSATAEDLPNASFAGQQETYLNIEGVDNLLAAIRLVFASLYNDRAIAYRVHQGFDHAKVAL
ncbi:MAG TPA: phosphoenolpyruvate synthase, partial [Betaproteobacteria bacterium]|nr:phosphoenolpyruvate synthase [Betaproteobacteria bacterium]